MKRRTTICKGTSRALLFLLPKTMPAAPPTAIAVVIGCLIRGTYSRDGYGDVFRFGDVEDVMLVPTCRVYGAVQGQRTDESRCSLNSWPPTSCTG